MDPRGRCQPPGVAGELWIGGSGLAVGYHRDQAATAARFVANPLGELSQRLYRTGDLARWGADGCLEFLGRLDHQVKVRGFRIELGDIEACLMRLPGVATTVAHVVKSDSGEQTLGVWYVGHSSGAPDVDAVRGQLSTELPAYMVPVYVTQLAAIPLSANGKIDRRALAPPIDRLCEVALIEAPCTPTEQALAVLWCDVLSIETVGRDADFLLLGGNSLLATRMVTRVRQDFAVDLTLRELLKHRTLAALTTLVDDRASTTRNEFIL